VQIATLVGTAGLLLSTSAWAQDVAYDYDRHADFGKLTTYAWAPTGRVDDELNHQRIVSAVDSQFAARGVRRVDSAAEADLVVAYRAVVGRDLEVSGNRAGPSRWASARIQSVGVGALVVDMTNATTHAVVWRGTVTRDLDPKASPEQREKNINHAVEKLFTHYPPAAK